MVTTDATPATLEAIWREFSQDLHAFIARRVPSPEDADDILQLVFVRIADGLSGLRDDTRLLGWMYTLTRNAITDHYRSAVHRREIATDAVPDLLERPARLMTMVTLRCASSRPACGRCSPGCPTTRRQRCG